MGRTLILTLPRLRAQAWLNALHEQGFDVVHWPATEINPVAGLDAGFFHDRIAASDWVLLPSPSAVIVLMRAFEQAGLDWPSSCGIGLVGPGSQRTLSEWFSRVPGLNEAEILLPVAEPFDARGLISHPVLARPLGLRVLVLHRPDGQTRWLRDLVGAGARLEVQALYCQRDLGLADSALEWLRHRRAGNQPVALSIASRGAGRWLRQVTAEYGLFDWVCGQPVLTHHPAIAGDLRALGFGRVLIHAPGVRPLADTLRALESA
jgi:uroporphyrinogen-III synthase